MRFSRLGGAGEQTGLLLQPHQPWPLVLGIDLDRRAEPGMQQPVLGSSSASRTGRRCTTLTQLPVAFSAGNSEKVEPVPGLRLSTVALNTIPG